MERISRKSQTSSREISGQSFLTSDNICFVEAECGDSDNKFLTRLAALVFSSNSNWFSDNFKFLILILSSISVSFNIGIERLPTIILI